MGDHTIPPPDLFADNQGGARRCQKLYSCCWSTPRFCRTILMRILRLFGTTNINLVYFIILLSTGGVLSLSATIQKPPGLDKKFTNYFFTVTMLVSILWMFGACACRTPPCGCCVIRREEAAQIPCYMIIGLTVFGLGSCFITGVDLMAWVYIRDCDPTIADSSEAIYNGVKMVFLLLQLHFFCRFSDVTFYRRWCTSFFILHIIGVNLSTWLYYIVEESAPKENSRKDITKCPSAARDMTSFEDSADLYLYPFNIEYTVMSSVLLLLMWFELRKKELRHENNQDRQQSTREEQEGHLCCLKNAISEICNSNQPIVVGSENEPRTMLFWKSAVTGFLIGIVMLIAFLILIALSAYEYYEKSSASLYYIVRVVLYLLMSLSTIVGLAYLPKTMRGFKRKALHSRVDSILIMIGVSGCYLMVLFELISGAYIEDSLCNKNFTQQTLLPLTFNATQVPWISINYTSQPMLPPCEVVNLFIADNVVSLLQFSFQSIYIVKALSRSKEEVALSTPKSLAFVRTTSAILSLANLGNWALDTFELKEHELAEIETYAYGSYWTILVHIAYPLCIFFRLHSAFCFFEIVINRFGLTQGNLVQDRERPRRHSHS